MYDQNPKQIQLDGAGTIRLVLALSTARITPFTPADWSGWSGAVGNACIVQFHPDDADYLARALGIAHWVPGYTTVILDELGVTWNGGSPVNSYAWQVQVRLQVDVHDAGTAQDVWALADRRAGALRFEEQISELPHMVRQLIMACPEEARPLVLTGYLQQRDRAAFAQDNPPAGPAQSELVHDWGGCPR